MRSAFCEKASTAGHFFGQTSETARSAKVSQVGAWYDALTALLLKPTTTLRCIAVPSRGYG